MDKKEWQAMSIDEKARHLNQRLASGESMSAFSQGLGIDRSNLCTKLKHAGYKLIEGQYKAQGIEGQLDLLGAALEATAKPKDDVKKKVVPAPEIAAKGRSGRPGREYAVKKLTIEIHEDVFKALHHFKIDEGIRINEFIENLVKEALPAGYLKNLKK